MSKYPHGWEIRSLGSLLSEKKERLGNGFAVPFSVSKVLGIVPQREKFKKRVASSDISKYKVIKKGDFAYDPMLLWDGSINRMNRDEIGAVSPAYVTFQINSNFLDSDYFLYFLKDETTKNFYKSISKGTNIRRQKAEFSDFAMGKVLLPPLDEQKKISEILSEIDHTIIKKREVRKKYRNLKYSLIQKFIFEKENIEIIPLKKLAYCFSGYPFSSDDFLDPSKGTYRIVRGDNLNEGFCEWGKKEKRWSSISHKMETFLLSEGDILVGMDGSKVGKNISVIKKEDLPALLGQRVCCIRANEIINQQFMAYFLGTIKFRRYVDIVKTGTSIHHISKKQIEDFSIPLPSLPYQKWIVKIISQIDYEIDCLAQEIKKLDNLKKAVALDLLSGRKRVNT